MHKTYLSPSIKKNQTKQMEQPYKIDGYVHTSKYFWVDYSFNQF